MKIGVIGCGFVGDAAAYGFAQGGAQVFRYDIRPELRNCTIGDIQSCDLVFVCVPAPTSKTDGQVQLGHIRTVLASLHHYRASDKVVVIKSTIPPGSMTQLKADYPGCYVFNPEFLTQRTARGDFLGQRIVVLGFDDRADADQVIMAYTNHLRYNMEWILTDYDTACMIKYARNSFFAAKVLLMNELKQVCEKTGANWDTVRTGLLASGWVNAQHTMVPGPDGKPGFGGKCFPKDLLAFVKLAEAAGAPVRTFQTAFDENRRLRPDDEDIVGAWER